MEILFIVFFFKKKQLFDFCFALDLKGMKKNIFLVTIFILAAYYWNKKKIKTLLMNIQFVLLAFALYFTL